MCRLSCTWSCLPSVPPCVPSWPHAPCTRHPRLIIDTDAGFDVDDMGALCIANALADQGETTLIAAAHTNAFTRGGGALSAVMTYYGRGEVPLGAYKGAWASDPDAGSHPHQPTAVSSAEDEWTTANLNHVINHTRTCASSERSECTSCSPIARWRAFAHAITTVCGWRSSATVAAWSWWQSDPYANATIWVSLVATTKFPPRSRMHRRRKRYATPGVSDDATQHGATRKLPPVGVEVPEVPEVPEAASNAQISTSMSCSTARRYSIDDGSAVVRCSMRVSRVCVCGAAAAPSDLFSIQTKKCGRCGRCGRSHMVVCAFRPSRPPPPAPRVCRRPRACSLLQCHTSGMRKDHARWQPGDKQTVQEVAECLALHRSLVARGARSRRRWCNRTCGTAAWRMLVANHLDGMVGE